MFYWFFFKADCDMTIVAVCAKASSAAARSFKAGTPSISNVLFS